MEQIERTTFFIWCLVCSGLLTAGLIYLAIKIMRPKWNKGKALDLSERIKTEQPPQITEFKILDPNTIEVCGYVYQRRQWIPSEPAGFGYEIHYYHHPKVSPFVKIGDALMTKEQLEYWAKKDNVMIPLRVQLGVRAYLNTERIRHILKII